MIRKKKQEENEFYGIVAKNKNNLIIPKIDYLSYDEKKKNEQILKEMFSLIEETIKYTKKEK